MSYNQPSTPPVQPREVVGWIAVVVGIISVLLGIIVALILVFSAVGRYNARKDAHNRVAVSKTEIQNQSQRVLIAQQQAQIRLEEAKGVREAQDEISSTLTPLYVQFEMVDALRQIAQSGKNNTVVYIPAGANGIPLVSTVNAQQVGQPDATAGG